MCILATIYACAKISCPPKVKKLDWIKMKLHASSTKYIHRFLDIVKNICVHILLKNLRSSSYQFELVRI
jgi:hypothetical protein